MVAVSTLSEHGSLAVVTSNSENAETPVPPKKGLKFWLVFASMCICLFLSALELSSIPTALPTIAHELRASQFIWVGSAYALSSTAFLPMSGGLAQAFGRRPAVLIAIGLFALGSGVCGAAMNMNVLIAGRTIQGLGGGGIQSLTSIVLADLVSLQERGVYAGLFGLTWCLATSIGPVVGGCLAERGMWRWLFYLNLPIALLAFLSVAFFLDLPTAPGNYRHKLRRMDWTGNVLVVASTTACTIGLTWGGTTAPWVSSAVLVPLVLGLLGLVVFIGYEASIAEHPLVPLALMTNSTSISGYIQSFCVALVTLTVVYFFPAYLQACKGVSSVLSGVYALCLCAFAPAAILAGVSVRLTGRYRPQIWSAWAMVLTAMGLLSAPMTEGIETRIGASLGYFVLLGLGTGGLNATTMYPIQAPLPVSQNAPALAWMWFLRSFAGVWGVTIGSAVLANKLSSTLPPSLLRSITHGTGTGTGTAPTLYALIPDVSSLPPELRSQVQDAFAEGLGELWQVLAAVCAVGGIASAFMRGHALNHTLDATWTIKRGGKERDRDPEEATRQTET